MQLLRSSVRSVVDNNLVVKATRAVEILMAEHQASLPAFDVLLPDKLGTLCEVLLKPNEAFQTMRPKVEAKLELEKIMWEGLVRTISCR